DMGGDGLDRSVDRRRGCVAFRRTGVDCGRRHVQRPRYRFAALSASRNARKAASDSTMIVPRIRKWARPHSCEQAISYAPGMVGVNQTGAISPGTASRLIRIAGTPKL